MDIVKAIIPAAGLGTRFLPYTKAIAKEMLPLLDKPAIQYIIEEGLASDITQFLMITARSKESIADHFDTMPELEQFLRERNKQHLLQPLNNLIKRAEFAYIRQQEPLGLGHAVSLARHYVGKEYVGIFLPDDIICSKQPGLSQLIRIARQEKASVIAVQEVPLSCSASYGMVAIKKQLTPNLFQVSHLVEKPQPKDAPSNLAIIGRYVLSPKIFQALDAVDLHSNGELQLTDGISHMMSMNEKVFAYKIQGVRYDIGNPVGWLKATIGFALQNPEYAQQIRTYLQEFDTIHSGLYDNIKNISHTIGQ